MELERFRREKDEFFRTHPQSPLTPAHAVDERRRAGLPTSGCGAVPVGGAARLLTLFSSAHPGLFLPFRDATSGRETYGGGRFLELDGPGADGRVEIDLNYAHNPYCAYNEAWTCPLPPPENWLEAPVRAGEMDFKA